MIRAASGRMHRKPGRSEKGEDILGLLYLSLNGINRRKSQGSYYTLKQTYSKYNSNIPIYSITFGEADETQLRDVAELTNAKVFDGKKDLLKAFKEVRSFN